MKFDRYEYPGDFEFRDNRIHLTPAGRRKVKRLKKITGSRMGAVLGQDDFRSPFQTWCAMFNFFTEEENTYFLEAGRRIEEQLRAYAESQMGRSFRTYVPEDCGYDVFKSNGVFGGIPDGEELDGDRNVVSILEIKTAQLDKYKWIFEDNQYKLLMSGGRPIVKKRGAGLAKWFRNGAVIIPKSYRYQLSLYMHLRGVDRGYFCVAFLAEEDYRTGSRLKFTSKFNNYEGYEDAEMPLLADKERILIWQEFRPDENFGEEVERARQWYEEHVRGCVSPQLTRADLEWFRYGYPQIK